MSTRAYSASESDTSESSENTYCIFLHVVEGIGLSSKEVIGDCAGDKQNGKIILNASLNAVKFEVEGHSTETSTIFNSNCIWECELTDIKRIKTDNRPIKLECYLNLGCVNNMTRKLIGSLLLPLRGLQTIKSIRNIHVKLHWHKLGALSPEWRSEKPEIYLLLAIVKKFLIDNGSFEKYMEKYKCFSKDILSPNLSETSLMLQSKSNIYVHLLEQVGLIQVGNNPDVDCDIFNVSLTFKQVKHLDQLVDRHRNDNSLHPQVIIFHYDFLGSASNLEIIVNTSDCYTINEKITLSFKSSHQSLRNYFQRIFYLPISLLVNGITVANYRLDFSKLLPEDGFFNTETLWTKNGTFYFDGLHKILSPSGFRPSGDYLFTFQLLTRNTIKNIDYNSIKLEESSAYNFQDKLAGDLTEAPSNMKFSQIMPLDNSPMSSCNYAHLNRLHKSHSEPSLTNKYKNEHTIEEEPKLVEKYKTKRNERESSPKKMHTIGVGTEDLGVNTEDICDDETENQTYGNRGKCDTEEFTLKVVQELEEWKEQQIECFLEELKCKEIHYLAELQQRWQQDKKRLQQKYDRQIQKYEELNEKLDQAYTELKEEHVERKKTNLQIAETVKDEIERNYANKLSSLEEEIKRLQRELPVKDNFRRDEIELESKRLRNVRLGLEACIEDLAMQLKVMQSTFSPVYELKTAVSDMHLQTQRYSAMEKSKNIYKEQWEKTVSELLKVKMSLVQLQDDNYHDMKTMKLGICLEEIFNDEEEILNTDRSGFVSTREELSASNETSSICDFKDD